MTTKTYTITDAKIAKLIFTSATADADGIAALIDCLPLITVEPVAYQLETSEFCELIFAHELPEHEGMLIKREITATALYTHAKPLQPITAEKLKELHHIEEFGLFCSFDEFEQIARAIEHEHGIHKRIKHKGDMT